MVATAAVVVVVDVVVVVLVVVNMKCSVTLWSVYGRGERDEKKVTKKYPSRDCKSVSGYIDSKAKKKTSTDEYISKIIFPDKKATRAIVKCSVRRNIKCTWNVIRSICM